jgi:hypothetical protein
MVELLVVGPDDLVLFGVEHPRQRFGNLDRLKVRSVVCIPRAFVFGNYRVRIKLVARNDGFHHGQVLIVDCAGATG